MLITVPPLAVFCREVITLYDLEQHLCHRLQVDSYDHLQLGPLLRAPIIVQHFSPPASLLKFPKVVSTRIMPQSTCFTFG